nr:immunoglobulin light chain junction region [Macaca mulatta]MOX78139.1 immunoglobulin light chain junction region [Macaca mulatta]MOX82861.1 immunoglobulin light chain junction region [Macaca mulatta]MOX84238.1 immunoglobulin light chain junction region [Macaca mulatta]
HYYCQSNDSDLRVLF